MQYIESYIINFINNIYILNIKINVLQYYIYKIYLIIYYLIYYNIYYKYKFTLPFSKNF